MRRTDRLFEIIQILRSENRVITANEIAARLEVSTRTIYRDIQTLQSMRTPIEGEAGIGYLMRQGYDLPALNFSAEEIEAIVVGLSLVTQTGDKGYSEPLSRYRTRSMRFESAWKACKFRIAGLWCPLQLTST